MCEYFGSSTLARLRSGGCCFVVGRPQDPVCFRARITTRSSDKSGASSRRRIIGGCSELLCGSSKGSQKMKHGPFNQSFPLSIDIGSGAGHLQRRGAGATRAAPFGYSGSFRSVLRLFQFPQNSIMSRSCDPQYWELQIKSDTTTSE